MNNNSPELRDFITKAALFIAEAKALAIEDALSFVYNSETFQLIEDNQLTDKSLDELIEIFKNEMRFGKAQ